MTVVLSNRGFAQLKVFAENPGKYFSIHDAGHWDQRSFGTMLKRGYVVYRAGKGFHVTREGRAAAFDFLNTDIARKIPSERLTHYFDPTSYGLSLVVKKRKPRKAVAA